MVKRWLAAIPVGLVLLTMSGCDRLCLSEEVSRSTSPDGRTDAIVVIRNCGAATGERTAVVLVGRGQAPPSTRFFDAYRTRGIFPPGLEWRGDTLMISQPLGAPVEQAPKDRRGVRVRLVSS